MSETQTFSDHSTFDAEFAAEHPFVSQDTHANPASTDANVTEKPPTPEDHFSAVEDMQKLAATSQRIQNTNEGAKIIDSVQPAVNAGKVAEGVLAGVSIVGLGAGLAAGMDAQAQKVQEVNQQQQDTVEQNLQQQKFDQGLDDGKVTIEVPSSESN